MQQFMEYFFDEKRIGSHHFNKLSCKDGHVFGKFWQ